MSEERQTEQHDDSVPRLAPFSATAHGHIRVVLGSSAVAVYDVQPSGTVIGRDAGDVRIDDARISRQHVRIERAPAGWQLTDLGSRNGGFVEGRMVQAGGRAQLGEGAVIRIGDSVLVFRTSPCPDKAREDACDDAPALPGVSPRCADVRRRIGELASASGHALILGETGTGKQWVARAIAASRKSHPFVVLNCKLRPELARSALFGQGREGVIEAAGDGVLFLDDFGELAFDVQVELLRFLEDGTYQSVAAQGLARSSARVVAATNVDLDRAIEAGRLRRDLAACLRASSAPLVLPPLRDRREDIPLWCRRFLEDVWGAEFEPWTAGALECLLLYPWPHNLRELKDVVRALFADQPALACPTGRLPDHIVAHRNALRNPRQQPAQRTFSHHDVVPTTVGPTNPAGRRHPR